MTILTEGQHRAEFFLTDVEKNLSYEVVTLTGGDYPAGKVLGQVTATGKFTEHDPGAADGTEVAAAILVDNVDASAADQSALVLNYHAAVKGASLQWKTGITAGQKTTAEGELAANNRIFVRY